MSLLEIISLVSTIVVLLLYTLIFIFLFGSRFKSKKEALYGINKDDVLTKELIKESELYFQQVEKSQTSGTKKSTAPYTFSDYMAKKHKKGSFGQVLVSFLFVILWLVLLALIAVGFVVKSTNTNKPIYFGAKGSNKVCYHLVEDNKMAEINEKNKTLLTDAGLADDKYRIKNQTMIKFERLTDYNQYNVFDVVAVRGESNDPNDTYCTKGEVLIRRIISIETMNLTKADGTTESVRFFQFKADSDSKQTRWESIGSSDIVYKDGELKGQYYNHDGTWGRGDAVKGRGLAQEYILGRHFAYRATDESGNVIVNPNPGWNNFALGVVVSYVESTLGLLCLASTFIVTLVYFIYDCKLIREEEKRSQQLIKLINNTDDIRFKWYDVKYRQNNKYKELTNGVKLDVI